MQSDRSQIYSIQGLRGLAALAVVIAHSFEHGKLGGVPALFTGRFGVEVFFVISGFVITLASGKGWFDPRDFAIRRFMRVAPLYWLTTFLVGGLAIALPSIFKNTSFDLSYFISSILFIPDPIPGTDDWRPLFKLGWTLNYEVFFYAIVCAFFWCRTSLLRSICLILVLITFVAISFGIEIRSGIASFYFNLNLMPFIAGVVVCEALRQLTTLMARMADYSLLLIVIAIASLYWALQYSHEEYRTFPGHIALTSAAVAVVLTALSIEHVFSRSASIWSWLGNISYSLYLLHMFVVGAGWAVLRRVAGRGHDSAITPFAIVVIVIVSLIAATISYRLFEKPLAKLARRLASRPAHDPLDPVVIPKAI